jgi:tetratricopeptide (TPR) repeat protein
MTDESSLEELRDRWVAIADASTGLAYGEALEEADRGPEAAAIYEALVSERWIHGYHALAWYHYERGDHDSAIELLKRYLADDDEPDDSTHYIEGVLGHWLRHAERPDEAEPLLRNGQDAYPSARVDLAQVLRSRGSEGEAEEVLRRGVAAGEAESYLPLANLLDESGRPDEAEQLYRLGYALGDAHSAFNLHLLLNRQGRPEAAEWLKRAADGGDAVALGWLMELGESEGDSA